MLIFLCLRSRRARKIASNPGTRLSLVKALPNLIVGVRKRGLLEKGSFQRSPFSREFRDSRQPPDCGKQRRNPPFSRDSRELRDFKDSRDASNEKTPFVMTPFSFRHASRACPRAISGQAANTGKSQSALAIDTKAASQHITQAYVVKHLDLGYYSI